jgi:hypothetical protein
MVRFRLPVEVVVLMQDFSLLRKVMVDVFNVVRKTGGFLMWDFILLTEQMMPRNMRRV